MSNVTYSVDVTAMRLMLQIAQEKNRGASFERIEELEYELRERIDRLKVRASKPAAPRRLAVRRPDRLRRSAVQAQVAR